MTSIDELIERAATGSKPATASLLERQAETLEAIVRKIAGTSANRAKRYVDLIAYLHDPQLSEVLLALTTDSNFFLRYAAYKALGNYRETQVTKALLSKLTNDRIALGEKTTILRTLARVRDPQSTEPITRFIDTLFAGRPIEADAMVEHCLEEGSFDAVEALLEAILVMNVLGDRRFNELVPALLGYGIDDSRQPEYQLVRERSAWVTREIIFSHYVPEIEAALLRPAFVGQEYLLGALEYAGSREASRALLALYGRAGDTVAKQAIRQTLRNIVGPALGADDTSMEREVIDRIFDDAGDPDACLHNGRPMTPESYTDDNRPAAHPLHLRITYGLVVPPHIGLVPKAARAFVGNWIAEHGARFAPGKLYQHGYEVEL